jgi:hypothetical protein
MDTPQTGRPDGFPRYEIRLQGHLDARWAASFDGFALRNEPDGTTVLDGPVIDQAALHGALQQVRDLGLPLISVTRLDPPRQHGSTTTPRQHTRQP